MVKPVVIFTVDGGPDENPRYQKVIDVAIHHFVKHNLDGLFIATNAPGRSAFNRVERRMAPLSRELSGLVLPHEHFGGHLDSQGRTVDDTLEKSNFQFAGETLSKIWSDVMIDKFPVIAEYIVPENSKRATETLLTTGSTWFQEHVRTSQYFTQMFKCCDKNCLLPEVRSLISNVLSSRIFPPPIPVNETSDGLKAAVQGASELRTFPQLIVAQAINVHDMLDR
jgi:hypothetical protein